MIGGGDQGGRAPHLVALALALMLASPLAALGLLVAGPPVEGGRAVAFAPPWRSDLETIRSLAAAGAAWATPLRLPGAWLVQMGPGGSPRARAGALLIPLGEGWTFLAGCAATPPRTSGGRSRGG